MTVMSDGLARLSKMFADQLPSRLAEIVEQVQALADVPWEVARVEKVHRQVHSLTGSGGTFGMPDVSDTARPLEVMLERLLKRPHGPNETETSTIDAALQKLQAVVEFNLSRVAIQNIQPIHPGSAQTYGPPPVTQPLIYIVEDDREQAEYYRQLVCAANYQVQVFYDLDTFHLACDRQKLLAAIIMDMGFVQGSQAGAEAIALLRTNCPCEVPVIFVSAQDSIGARLAAYRAGANHYLTKPVNGHQLLEQLARLTLRTPIDPYRVLLVDDDPLLLQAMADMLRAAGMVVRAEQSALKTLDVLRDFKPDVLLLDVYMPDCNGPELAMVLREQNEYVAMPILFLSVECDVNKQAMALRLGGDDFLMKPVQQESLVLAVTTRAGRARAIREAIEHPSISVQKDKQGADAAGSPKPIESSPVEVNRSILSAKSAKSRFLSNMSHEMRTPLNAILGYAQLVQMDLRLQGESGELVRDGAQEITKAGQHLLSLINDVLDLAKIEAGRMEVTLGPVWLDELFIACQSVAEPLAKARSVTLKFQYEQSRNMMINADGVRIKQVLLSLISNAIKYNRSGGQVLVSWRQPTPFLVQVQVADTGAGLTGAQMAQLYTPFERLGAEQGNIEGAGIGLAMSRQLVELMGGVIGGVSQIGEGSTFWFELPVVQAAELLHPAIVWPAATQTESISTMQKKVLYIEDSATNVRLMRKIMAKRPELLMQDVPSAELGLPLAQSFRPDLILLDLNLPGMDGYQALLQLRQIEGLQQTPVIAVTANAMMVNGQAWRPGLPPT